MILSEKIQLIELNKYFSFTDEEINAVWKVFEAILGDDELREYAKRAVHGIFTERKVFEDVAGDIPERVCKFSNNMFWTAVYLSGLKFTEALYDSKGIDRKILSDSVKDMVLWLRFHKSTRGVIGQSEPQWLWWSFTGRLFRLGRLEFAPERFWGNAEAYRSKKTGEVLWVCAGGVKYRKDGYADGLLDIFDEKVNTTENGVYLDLVRAQRVKNERIDDEPTYLFLDEYDRALGFGDNVLEVHIPQGEKMDFNECLKSFDAAKKFFPKYFGYEFKAFVCWSWLLDPVWKTLLEKNTNIRRFCEPFTVEPRGYSGDGGDVRFFVFGNRDTDLSSAEAKTSLQKKNNKRILKRS